MGDNRGRNQGTGTVQLSNSPSHGVGADEVHWCPGPAPRLLASVLLPLSLSPLLSPPPCPPPPPRDTSLFCLYQAWTSTVPLKPAAGSTRQFSQHQSTAHMVPEDDQSPVEISNSIGTETGWSCPRVTNHLKAAEMALYLDVLVNSKVCLFQH